jgi:nicotinamidase-related amidase
VRSAVELGYNVVVLADCTAALSVEEQEFATGKVLPMFARVLTHTEFLAELE